MARKKIFSDRRRHEAFAGTRRRTLSFEEVERQVRPRKAPLRKTREDSTPSRAFKQRGKARGPRITGVHIAVGLVLAGLLAFGLYFLFFMLPSPIGGLSPSKGSYVKTPTVEVKAAFSRAVKPSQLTVKVDGKDTTMKSTVASKTLSCMVNLQDGRHQALVELDGGGLMGKRTASWTFVVDTTSPELSVTDKKVSDVEGTGEVKVTFKGKTDKGAQVRAGKEILPVSSSGAFSGSATASRARSFEVTATDQAGNKSSAFVVTQKPPVAKGAHVSVYLASSDSDMAKMMDLVDRTELNALEIDLKDEAGQVAFLLDNDLAKQINSLNDYVKLDGLVDSMRYRGIYTICRIVCFKDPKLAKARPDLAVQDKAGGLWGKGQWLDPYSKDVWDYNLAVAEAAARAGFHEIQFDYVRFPSDGNTSTCLYPNQDSRKPVEVIDDYLAYAREQLAPYNVFVSADLFGLTASKQGDMGIGQDVKSVAGRVDFISPMVYPSHYNTGEYGIKNPESNPGDIVTASIKEFKKVMAGTPSDLRPWLQDFSLRITYSPDMVRRQIDACEKLGVKQWLLWDPDCTYSESALRKEKGSD
jgi:hypothetical protein